MTHLSPRAALVCLSLVAAPYVVAAQQPPAAGAVLGSRYLSIENAGYEAIAQLRTRGLLAELDPLAQPYHRIDIARAIAAFNPDTFPQPISHWLKLLRDEMGPELARLAGRDSIMIGAEALVGVSAATSRSRTPILPYYNAAQPATLGNRVWPSYGVGGWGEVGRFAAVTRVYDDFYISSPFAPPASGPRGDPFGLDPGGIVVFKQNDDAYLSTTYSLGTLFIGRMARNWAPVGDTGLMISNNPTTYPQVGFDIGAKHVRVRWMAGELDTAGGQFTGQARFITANMIEYRTDQFAISIGEAKLVVSPSGMPWTELNPFALTFFEQDIVPVENSSNSELTGQLWLHRGRLTVSGEAMLDDIHLSGDIPYRAAISGAVQYQPGTPWLEVGADLRAVSAFCYWTTHGTDQWTTYGRGLGDNFSDYVRLTAHASIFPSVAGLRITPAVAWQQKGEGDMRMVIPVQEFLTGQPFFLGVKETTFRASVSGRYDPTPHVFASWDAGVNFIANANHQAGRNLTQFQGVTRFGVIWSAPGLTSH